jgi:hypothetical protein
MNRRLLALALAAALPALASDKPAGPANAPTGPTPAAGSVSSHPGSMQLAPVIKVKNLVVTPGEKVNLSADVSQSGAPASGLVLTFSVDGAKVGDATTNAAGLATISFKVPGTYKQPDHHAIKATHATVSATGDMGVVKSATVMKIDNFHWGTYKDEAGPPSGTYTFLLTRTSDGNAIVNPPVPVDVTVNGAPYNQGHIDSSAALMPLPDLPAGQKTWKVKVAFAGNASYLASSDEKTFTKP